MANDSSFDVVSRLDRQEVDNAVNQCAKEISQRYDFRGVDASVSLSGDTITLEANTAERVLAILDVLESKLFRRGVSLKALDLGRQGAAPLGQDLPLGLPAARGTHPGGGQEDHQGDPRRGPQERQGHDPGR